MTCGQITWSTNLRRHNHKYQKSSAELELFHSLYFMKFHRFILKKNLSSNYKFIKTDLCIIFKLHGNKFRLISHETWYYCSMLEIKMMYVQKYKIEMNPTLIVADHLIIYVVAEVVIQKFLYVIHLYIRTMKRLEFGCKLLDSYLKRWYVKGYDYLEENTWKLDSL